MIKIKNKLSNAFYILLALVLLTSCDFKEYKNFKSDKLELRQLTQETSTKTSTYSSFFIIAGSYSKNEYEETKVKAFAKVEGRFRLIEMPINDVRINIDNTIITPNVEIEYMEYDKKPDEYLISDKWISKVYVINCPDKYLPKKLLPIGL